MVAAAPAFADEPREQITARDEDAKDAAPLALDPEATNGLHLDPLVRLSPSTVSLARGHEGAVYQLGHHTRLAVDGSWYQLDRDAAVRGWRASAIASHDFGAAQLWVGAAAEHLDTDIARGTFTDLGVGIVRTHRFAHDAPLATLSLGLSLGYRHWLGDKPPAGEADAASATLSVGGTWR